jgi:LysR substrate binding domain
MGPNYWTRRIDKCRNECGTRSISGKEKAEGKLDSGFRCGALVIPNDHRLARQRSARLNDLRGERLILPSPGFPTRALLNAPFEAQAIEYQNSIDTPSLSACQMTARRLGGHPSSITGLGNAHRRQGVAFNVWGVEWQHGYTNIKRSPHHPVSDVPNTARRSMNLYDWSRIWSSRRGTAFTGSLEKRMNFSCKRCWTERGGRFTSFRSRNRRRLNRKWLTGTPRLIPTRSLPGG